MGSVAIFAVWPWNGILDRFLISLGPMVLLAFARGIEVVIRLVPGLGSGRAAVARLTTVALLGVVLGNSAVVARAVGFYHSHGGQWPGTANRLDLSRALELIRTRTEPDAVIASAWPEMVYLHTGRTSVPLFEDEAVLTGRFGDVSRLRLWRAITGERPFYLLHRSLEQNIEGADDAQIAALTAPGSGLTLQPIVQTTTGLHRISRVVATPSQRTRPPETTP